jgi:amino acid adenylation domain-containing protein
VAIEHRKVLALLSWAQLTFSAAELSGVLLSTSMCFDLSVFELFAPLCQGGRVFLCENALQLATLAFAQAVTLLNTVPSLASELVRLQAIPSSIRTVNLAGEALPTSLVQQLYRLKHLEQVYNLYGPSEDTTYSTAELVKRDLTSAPALGRPLPHKEAYVLDRDQRLVPIGVVGELYLGGAGLARGYLGQPALTAERFVPHPFGQMPGARLYRSGDRVRMRKDGTLEFLGRLDQQVKVRGFRIEPGEIEAMLRQHPQVREALVVVREQGGERQLVAYLAAVAPQEALQRSELRAWLARRLPGYLVPAHLVVLDALPLSPNGKLDRRALPAPTPHDAGEVAVYQAPRTPIEELLAGIWAEVLHVEQVGVHDHFFALGGYSLPGMQVISRVKNALGTEVPLRLLFEQPTLAAFARQLAEQQQPALAADAPLLQAEERPHVLPLSFAQQRLWFLDQLRPRQAFYNVYHAVRLRGPLQLPVFRQSLQHLVERHEALRTTVGQREGVPIQQIGTPEQALAEVVCDLRALPARMREQEMWRLAHQEARRPFDLAQGPVLRSTLLRLREQEHVWLLTLHHLSVDEWSLTILWQELAACYTAGVRGQTVCLPELPVQYADYALWQRAWLQGERRTTREAYWTRQLQGAPILLGLPSDGRRLAEQGLQGATQRFLLSADLSQGLRALSRREGVTLFMTLLAAFQILLARLSGQQDVVVGTPIANRTCTEVEGVVGCFVNTLALRTQIVGTQRLREVLRRVREMVLEAYAHQELPFEQVVDTLHLERALDRHPLAQVFFAFQDVSAMPQALGELAVERLPLDNGTAKFELSLIMGESAQGLWGELEYNSELFTAETIARWQHQWQRLLEGLVADANSLISDLDLLPAEERRQLLQTCNATAVAYPREQCLSDLVAAQAARTPQAIALVCGPEQVSYGVLEQRSTQLAHLLRQRGVGPEQRVGLCMERSVDLVVGMLGILKAGGAYVPLDPGYPAERVALILQDARMSVMVTQHHLCASLRLSEQQMQLICLDTDGPLLDVQAMRKLPTQISMDNLAYVIYTSGSTGRPKGVQITRRGLLNLLYWHRNAYHIGPADRASQIANSAFDACAWEVWPYLICGASVHLAPEEVRLAPELLQRWLLAQQITIAFIPTPLMAQLLTTGWPQHTALRFLLTGGDTLASSPTARHPFTLVNHYGPTESTVVTTAGIVAAAERQERLPSIGRPIANTQVYVLDAHLHLLPIGVAGELYIGGVGLSRGYLGQPTLTAECFVPHPFGQEPGTRLYRSGDRVRMHADGTLEFLGRLDQQVKVRGFRIEPGEIEATLRQHPQVGEAVVVVREEGGERSLVAYLLAVAGQEAPPRSELRAWLAGRLPGYLVPAHLLVLEALPLLPNGKLDRRALPAPSLRDTGEAVYQAPRTPIEELLAGIWAEVLHIEQVGRHDHFFARGGHSLLATRVVSRASGALGREVPLRLLFEQPILAAFAQRLAAEQQPAQTADAPVLQAGTRPSLLPLSFAQQRLWFLDQLQPRQAFYNVYHAVRLRGPLQVPLFLHSLQHLVGRHEALRTTVGQREGVPIQQIGTPEQALAGVVCDLTALSVRMREQEMQRLAHRQARQPFDLTQGPVLRSTLLRLGEQEHIWLLTQHHLSVDEWSLTILWQELAACYTAGVHGQAPRLPALPVQYADYALWQRAWLQGERRASQEAYWTRQLQGAPTLPGLPSDGRRLAEQGWQGATQRFLLPVELSQALTVLSRREGVTLFMTLLAAFQVLLARLSGQEDIVVGTPIANRTRTEVEGVVGCFVNTLALRTRIVGTQRVREVLRRVREVALEAYAHQELPFEQVVDALHLERALDHHPLVQVFFAFQNISTVPLELGEVAVEPLPLDNGTAKFELSLTMGESAQGLWGELEYNSELFAAETMARWQRQWQRLLEGFVADAEGLISDLDLLPAEERHQLLQVCNATAVAYPRERCLPDLVRAQAARTPQAIALVCGQEQVSYGVLEQRSTQLAHLLRRRGVGPEQRVGLCMERSVDLIVGLLGILKAGGAYVPLDPEYPAERLALMLQDGQVALLLTQRELAGRVPEQEGVARLVLAEIGEQVAQEPQTPVLSGLRPENLAYVIYTSGSTGRPKGVMNTHGGIVNRLLWMQDRYQLTAEDRVFQKTPYSFDVSVWEFFWPLISGACLVVAEPGGQRDSAYVARQVVEQSLTTMHFVPSMLQVFLQEPALEQCHSLKRVICSGEALPFALQERFFARLPAELHNLYGPTEAAVDVTFWACTPETTGLQIVPIGRPLANMQVYVLDRYQMLVPIGVVGELYLGGVGLARGYLGQPGLTAECFVPHPFSQEAGARLYRSGDQVRMRADGALEFLGRLDQQVKVRGFRIETGEIEATLRQHPQVREAVVVVREEEGERSLVAYLLAVAPQEALSKSEVRAWLAGRLPGYLIPARLVMLEALPLSPNGKLDRRALAALSLRDAGETAAYQAPRTPIEELLAGIWAEVLHIERVGRHDHFFARGGHSLLATRVVSRASQALGREVPLRLLFEQPTLAAFARRLAEQQQPAQAADAPVLQAGERPPLLPLSFAQQRLWFLDQLQPRQAFYNLYHAVRLRGPLQVPVFLRSLQHLVERHEALRTMVGQREGMPIQQIGTAEQALAGVVCDLTALSVRIREQEMRRLGEQEVRRPFDLARGPVLRSTLLRLREQEYAWLLTLHHLSADEWSLTILWQELAACYTAGVCGQAPRLPALAVQYADYALWQRAWLQGERRASREAYWSRQLQGAPALLGLPTDRQRPPEQGLQGDTQHVLLPVDLSQELAALSRREGVTLFMTLLAALQVLLARLSGQEDVVVGTPIANRTRTEVEGVVGCFVNTLALRTRVEGTLRVREVLRRVREVALEAYAHQELPFEQVVETLRPERSLSYTPLFQVVFVLQNTPAVTPVLQGMAVTAWELDPHTAKFDITLDMSETEQGVVGRLTYNTDLFRASTITLLLEHFRHLLKEICKDPERCIADIPLQEERVAPQAGDETEEFHF